MLNVTCIPSGVVPASMVTQWLGARLKPHMLPVRVEPETASPKSPVRYRPVSGPEVVIPRKAKRPFNGEDACAPNRANPPRSEEHTSELQSLTNLVCRLLLEKKKK